MSLYYFKQDLSIYYFFATTKPPFSTKLLQKTRQTITFANNKQLHLPQRNALFTKTQ